MKASVLVCCWCAWAAISGGQPLPFVPTPIDNLTPDRAGRVWAIHRDTGLSQWNGHNWQPFEVPLPPPPATDPTDPTDLPQPPRAFPLLLQTNLQGTAYVLWAQRGGSTEQEGSFWITQLGDTGPPLSAVFRARLSAAFVAFAAFGPDGHGWLTEAGPHIYRIRPDLKVELAYTIQPDRMAGTRFDQFNPVQATPDERGGVWLWGEQRFRDLATLRGLWVANESGVSESPPIEGLPSSGFSFLTPVAPGLLWAGVPAWDPATGLYQIDGKSQRAVRLPDPSPAAFAHVLGVHPVGEDRYVIAADQSPNLTLWRWRKGSWQELFAPLDAASFDDYYRIARPFFTSPEGLWIGTGGNGLLHVPASADSTAVVYDWRKGQPLESVHRIVPLEAGRVLMAGFGQGTTYLRLDDLQRGRTISPRIVDLWKTGGNLQVDSKGHLWTLLGTRVPGAPPAEPVLARWDGAEWTPHPLPLHVRQGDLGAPLGLDTQGRFWVPYRERLWIPERQELRLTDKVDVFLPTTSRWEHFDSLESAFTNLLRAAAHARVDLPGPQQPEFGADGRICFLGMDWARRDRFVHYFDGAAWHRWDLASVGFARPGSIGQPYFIDGATLAINFGATRNGDVTARFDGQRWSTVPFRSAGPRDPMNLSHPTNSRSHPTLVANDATARTRPIDRRRLASSEPGISIPQFRTEDVHPFIGARRPDQVWTDARGNLVLSTRLSAGNLSGHRQYLVLAPLDPKTPARMDRLKLDSGGVELLLGAANHPSVPIPEGFTAVEIDDRVMVLRWSGNAVLEVADHVEGPWMPIPHAASPHAVPTTKPSGFYRIRR